MSKRGCLTVIVLFVVVGVVGSLLPKSSAPQQSKVAPPAAFTVVPNPATADALEGTAKVEAQTATATPSATITDTPTTAASPTALATVAAAIQDTVVIESFAPMNYYVKSTANARSCPDTKCDSLGKLQAGQTISVDGAGHGGDFKGSDVWVRTNVNGQVAYVHSSLVIEASLVSQPQQQVQSVATQPVSVPVQQTWNCSGDIYNCKDFDGRPGDLSSYWNSCPGDPSNLDGGKGDGVPCNG